MLLGLAAYACYVGDFARAAEFLFEPDIRKLTGETWLNVLGQAFFSIGAGSMVYMAYASYAGPTLNIVRASWVIALAVVLVSIAAGLAIFPIVFAYGLDPSSGPGLAFVTLPLAFAQMPGGQFFGVVFLLLLFVAAITSSVSMLEVAVSSLADRFQLRRRSAVLFATSIAWLLGLLAALSFNVLADVHPLGFIPALASKNFFDLFNEFAANVLLPVGGLLLTIFVGYVLNSSTSAAELGLSESSFGFRVWRFLLCYVAPLAVLTVFWMSTFG
jgi:NSS family neurotransmitter:Na+ symporter